MLARHPQNEPTLKLWESSPMPLVQMENPRFIVKTGLSISMELKGGTSRPMLTPVFCQFSFL